MRFINTFLILLFLSPTIFCQTNENESEKNGELLDLFVGEWEGIATAYYEREEGKEPRIENVVASAKKTLKDTYVRIKSKWTNIKGGNRELEIFWNYDKRSDKYEILFIYDNWPGKANYQLDYDLERRTLNGYDTFTASGGVAAEEKVTWKISQDGNEIISTEYNHYETDPKDYWAKSFEFIWRKKQ